MSNDHLFSNGVTSRRHFLAALGAGVASAAGVRALAAQLPAAESPAPASTGEPSAASNVNMDPSGYRPVGRPAKPTARPLLTTEQRDALEHRLKCQCPCTLDIYTCRTTDFSCGISPAMHEDVQRLVAGGYSADEIIDAFQTTYGERVLMAPTKTGFNWTGYFMPFVALGTGTVVVAALLKRWGARAAVVNAVARAEHTRSNGATYAVDATPDELARLEAAVRGEDDRR